MADVTVTLTGSGSGMVAVAGRTTPLRGAGLEAAREEVRQLVARAAREAGRALVMEVSEPSGLWQVAVAPDGTVSAAGAGQALPGAGSVAPPPPATTSATAPEVDADDESAARPQFHRVVRVGVAGGADTVPTDIAAQGADVSEPVSAPSPASVMADAVPAPALFVPQSSGAAQWEPAQEPGGGDKRRHGRVIVVAALALVAIIVIAAGAWAVSTIRSGADQEAPEASEGQASAAAEPEAPAVLRAGSGSWLCQADAEGVACWGATADGGTEQRTQVSGIDGAVQALSVGRGFAVAVTGSGAVYAWGAGDSGQLGVAQVPPAGQAVHVGDLPGPVSELVSGTEHTCAISDGQVWCLGSSRVGQVGGVVTADPVGLTLVELDGRAVSLGTSGWDTWAVMEGGSIVAWGSNQWGQVSDATGVSMVPTVVADGGR
ncbi:RCC1 domain-containing protein [Actinomyces faecalis]|uniref:RCC1 domain-containing protein n=1 Tax=Actinomyces faecalis TaxID=2722820 RepID=UPI001557BDE3|nr:hypothetical protein [Actinomyces faecalis]